MGIADEDIAPARGRPNLSALPNYECALAAMTQHSIAVIQLPGVQQQRWPGGDKSTSVDCESTRPIDEHSLEMVWETNPSKDMVGLPVRTAQETFNYYESRLRAQLYTYLYYVPCRDVQFEKKMIKEMLYIYRHVTFVKKSMSGAQSFKLPCLSERLVANGYTAGNGYIEGVEAYLKDNTYPEGVKAYLEDQTHPPSSQCLEHHRIVLDPAKGLELSDDEDCAPGTFLPEHPAVTLELSDKESDKVFQDPSPGLDFSDEEIAPYGEFSNDEDVPTDIAVNAGTDVQSMKDPSAGMELSDDDDVAAGLELSDDEDIAVGMELLD
ncbi:hypothetical protein DXG01_004164 [Tephrocybe rancida]|nr:hypothetical protein DXG01_004164 [Tephrocybe rancida]